MCQKYYKEQSFRAGIGGCLEKLQLPLSSLNAAFNANSKMVNYISVALTVQKWHKNYH
jgi:hypothetical protein